MHNKKCYDKDNSYRHASKNQHYNYLCLFYFIISVAKFKHSYSSFFFCTVPFIQWRQSHSSFLSSAAFSMRTRAKFVESVVWVILAFWAYLLRIMAPVCVRKYVWSPVIFAKIDYVWETLRIDQKDTFKLHLWFF